MVGRLDLTYDVSKPHYFKGAGIDASGVGEGVEGEGGNFHI